MTEPRTEPKFTPGPWRVLSASERDSLTIAGRDDSYIGLAGLAGEGRAEANAALIAAAPEMYAALARLKTAGDLLYNVATVVRRDYENASKNAAVILAKAEGRAL